MVIKNCKIIYQDKIEEGSILIKDGKIHGELLNNKKKKIEQNNIMILIIRR